MLTALMAAILMPQGTYSGIIRVHPQLVPILGKPATWTSEVLRPGIDWDEAIVSWNIFRGENARLSVEIQAASREIESTWYRLADWSGDLGRMGRKSVPNQTDGQGAILTDLLRVKNPFEGVRLRLTLDQYGDGETPRVRLMSVCFSNSKIPIRASEPKKGRKVIEAPQLAQGPYEYGKLMYRSELASTEFENWFKGVTSPQYCSPTSVAMVLQYWSLKLNRAELGVDVPDAVIGTFDEKYPGTGNWPFNTAYMGSFEGIRAYVTRLAGLEELEELVEVGIPVVCSVSHNLLRGTGKPGGDGHLVVLLGFNSAGDPVFNDPGKTNEVRRTFQRENFEKAWTHAGRTVYICHPENLKPPALAGILP